MIDANDIRQTLARLERLGRDLVQAAELMASEEGPLDDEERRAYVSGLQDAACGIEASRTVLAWVKVRLGEKSP